MKQDPSQVNTMPERPANIDDIHWQMFTLYHGKGDTQISIAAKYKMKLAEVQKTISKIAEQCKLSSYCEDIHNSKGGWEQYEQRRLIRSAKFQEAKELAIYKGLKTVFIKSDFN